MSYDSEKDNKGVNNNNKTRYRKSKKIDKENVFDSETDLINKVGDIEIVKGTRKWWGGKRINIVKPEYLGTDKNGETKHISKEDYYNMVIKSALRNGITTNLSINALFKSSSTGEAMRFVHIGVNNFNTLLKFKDYLHKLENDKIDGSDKLNTDPNYGETLELDGAVFALIDRGLNNETKETLGNN